jgi:hypothetical protein
MGIDIIFKDFYSFFNQVKVKENIGNNSLKVFPNPANNNITIEGATEGPYNVAILDYSGRTVFSKNNLPNNNCCLIVFKCFCCKIPNLYHSWCYKAACMDISYMDGRWQRTKRFCLHWV